MDVNAEILYRNSHRNVTQVSMNFKRELHNKINWDARIIGIKGPKGVGKSTLLKQHIKEAFPDGSHVLYVSLDDILALQVPFIPKMEDLYTQLETSREQGLKLLDLLEKGAMLGQLKTRAKAVMQMSSPDKLFLDNPNLMYAFNRHRQGDFFLQSSWPCA